jgi:monoamine oxidase
VTQANALAGQITLGSELVAVKRNNDATYTLTFRQGNTSRTVTADRVVLAIPFSILRRSVDLSRGEHTSVDFQGYLNGAVETGERAATEVLDSLA